MQRLAVCLMLLIALPLAAGVNARDSSRIQEGHAVFARWCAGCHSSVSPFEFYHGPSSGTLMLQRLYQGKEPPVLTDRTDLSPVLIQAMVRHGRNFMPFFRKTEISDAQLGQLVAYLTRNNPPSH